MFLFGRLENRADEGTERAKVIETKQVGAVLTTVQRLSRDNSLWGAERIQGTLRLLG